MREVLLAGRRRGLLSLLSFYYFLFILLAPPITCQSPTDEAITTLATGCYDECGDALYEAQMTGLLPELCQPDGRFAKLIDTCQTCLTNKGDTLVNEDEALVQYVDYCRASPAPTDGSTEQGVSQSTESSSAAPTVSAFPDNSTQDNGNVTDSGTPSVNDNSSSELFPTEPFPTEPFPTAPFPTATGRACQRSFCDNALESWRVFVKYHDLFDTETGCRNISNRNELHVLEDCSSTPGCIVVPQNVTDMLNSCKNLLAQALIGTSSTPTHTRTGFDTITNVPKVTKSVGNISTDTVAADSRSAAAAAGQHLNAKINTTTLRNILIIAGAGVLVIFSSGLGTYLVCKRRINRGMQRIPDLPPPSLSYAKYSQPPPSVSYAKYSQRKSQRRSRGMSRFRPTPSPVEMYSSPVPPLPPIPVPPPILKERPNFVSELEGDTDWTEMKKGRVSYYNYDSYRKGGMGVFSAKKSRK